MKLLKYGVIAVLAGTVALFADQTRIWTNNTDRPWTVELITRDQGEKGNMVFTDLTGQDLPERPTLAQVRALPAPLREVSLGEASAKPGGVKSLTLPRYSRWLVEFTHSSGAFYHAFKVSDIYGYDAGQLACDDPLINPKGFSLKSIGKEGPKAFLALNGPERGDLTLNPAGYKLINGSKHALRVTVVQRPGVPLLGHLRYQPMSFSPSRDFWVDTSNAKEAQLDGDPDGWVVPPGDAVELRGADTLSQAALELAFCAADAPHDPIGGGWDLKVTFDAGKPYPANAHWACLKAGMVKAIPEARLKELASRGQLKLELK